MDRIATRFLGLILLPACLGIAAESHATTRNVPGDYAYIQAAIDVSSSGDVVLVAPGTYVGALSISADHGGIELRSSGGPEVTTIDGGSATATIQCSSTSAPVLIEGFTITGAVTYTAGGGIHLSYADATIRDNVITGNRAPGIYTNHSNAVIDGNLISYNRVPNGAGGGIYVDQHSTAQITDNVIMKNSCVAFGSGVIVAVTSSADLIGNTIVENHSTTYAGGLYCWREGATMTVSRTIIAYNTQNGVEVGTGGSITLSCCDVYENSLSNFVGLPDPTGTDGNISQDPLFCDLFGLDLHLMGTSPCAEEYSPGGCGQIGALAPNCGLAPARRTTWGQVKGRYAK